MLCRPIMQSVWKSYVLWASKFDVNNIYIQDEYGLLYRMGPKKSYLMPSESRSEIRGTAFQKRKQRITTVYCVNSSGSHMLPMNISESQRFQRASEITPTRPIGTGIESLHGWRWILGVGSLVV